VRDPILSFERGVPKVIVPELDDPLGDMVPEPFVCVVDWLVTVPILTFVIDVLHVVLVNVCKNVIVPKLVREIDCPIEFQLTVKVWAGFGL